MAHLIFITGGARSGKSQFAQKHAESHTGSLLYIATAHGFDQEMFTRIERHKAERDGRWQTIEEPIDWSTSLHEHAKSQAAVLIDCLTIWISNLLLNAELDEQAILKCTDMAISAIRSLVCPVYVVSNEVGQGIVPANKLGRNFRDLSGLVNQRFGAAADEAWVMVAGLPLRLK